MYVGLGTISTSAPERTEKHAEQIDSEIASAIRPDSRQENYFGNSFLTIAVGSAKYANAVWQNFATRHAVLVAVRYSRYISRRLSKRRTVRGKVAAMLLSAPTACAKLVRVVSKVTPQHFAGDERYVHRTSG